MILPARCNKLNVWYCWAIPSKEGYDTRLLIGCLIRPLTYIQPNPIGQMGINKARGMDQSGAPLEIDGEQAVIWLVVEFRGKYSSDI